MGELGPVTSPFLHKELQVQPKYPFHKSQLEKPKCRNSPVSLFFEPQNAMLTQRLNLLVTKNHLSKQIVTHFTGPCPAVNPSCPGKESTCISGDRPALCHRQLRSCVRFLPWMMGERICLWRGWGDGWVFWWGYIQGGGLALKGRCWVVGELLVLRKF